MQGGTWACESCTYLNDAFATSCEICQTTRGNSAALFSDVRELTDDGLAAAMSVLRDVTHDLRVNNRIYYSVRCRGRISRHI